MLGVGPKVANSHDWGMNMLHFATWLAVVGAFTNLLAAGIILETNVDL